MNNNQFRKLVLDKPVRDDDGSPSSGKGATPSSFAAKRSSFMTPRTVQGGGGGVDFARQVRERNAALQPTKKFRSSAPKGAKLGKAYTDRARAREGAEDVEDDKAARIQALEEQMKLEQISKEAFEQLRDQIAGGDVSSTHLVKGLDRRLLERVRRGEDVLGVNGGDTAVEPPPDVDEELDKLGEIEVLAMKKEQVEKKGSMAAPPQVAGKKRSRDEIMAELKAQRQAAIEAKAAPMLDSRWRKVSEQQKSRIEIDHKGREVLITVDEDGVVKRKVRKVPVQTAEEAEADRIEMPDVSRPVLGADVVIPEAPAEVAAVEEEDDDIFEGAGTEYNPLGDDAEDEDDEDDDSEVGQPEPTSQIRKELSDVADDDLREDGEASEDDNLPGHAPSTETTAPPARRSYFNDTSNANDKPSDRFAGIQNVLKRVAQLDSTNREGEDDEERDGECEEARKARLKRRAQMLANQDRDLEDMDMGFGGSRLEDEVDGDEDSSKKIRLSEWKGGKTGEDDDEDGKAGGERRDKKKRKPKKRKGDVNNAADIMRVIQGRKGGGK